MKIEGDTVYFKTLPRYYLLEKYGDKPNTTREIPSDEMKHFFKLRHDLKYITIANLDTNESFTRKLTNISTIQLLGVWLWVFSWQSWGLLRD